MYKKTHTVRIYLDSAHLVHDNAPSKADMTCFLLMEGFVPSDLKIGTKELTDLYESTFNKSKAIRSSYMLKDPHAGKRTSGTARRRRGATIPESSKQYYKMSKSALMRTLEPFGLDSKNLPNTALAKLCCLYHSEITGRWTLVKFPLEVGLGDR